MRLTEFAISRPLWLAAILAGMVLLALAWIIWRELAQTGAPRRNLRLCFTGLAMLSMLALALEPQMRMPVRPDTALLLTSGSSPEEARDLIEKYQIGSKIFCQERLELWRSDFESIKLAPDMGALCRNDPEVQRLVIAGHGLPGYELAELQAVELIPALAPPEPGIRSIDYRRQITLGQSWRIQGQLLGNAGAGPCRIYLADIQGLVDSTVVHFDRDTRFELSTRPRSTGRLQYQISVVQNETTLAVDTIGVSVTGKPGIDVLLLESSPQFETKYLKQFVSEQGAIAIRTKISRNRFREEFINLKSFALNRLSTELLDRFDLILIDDIVLDELSKQEYRMLVNAVTQGLGVLILSDGSGLGRQHKSSPQAWLRSWQLKEIPGLDERLVRPVWDWQATGEMTQIPVYPFEIIPEFGTYSMVTDQMSRSLVACRQIGRGKVAVSLVKDSYRWILEGNRQWHRDYWSHLMSRLARPQTQERWAVAAAGPLFVHQPLTLSVASQRASLRGVTSDGSSRQDSLFLAQDHRQSDRWTGIYWPRQSGWHRVTSAAGDDSTWFYVQSPENWQTIQQSRRYEATRKFAALQALAAGERQAAVLAQRSPISLVSFFLIFIMSCTVLWLERKWR